MNPGDPGWLQSGPTRNEGDPMTNDPLGRPPGSRFNGKR
jgi:hypothetical protein